MKKLVFAVLGFILLIGCKQAFNCSSPNTFIYSFYDGKNLIKTTSFPLYMLIQFQNLKGYKHLTTPTHTKN